jgi:hypothetical protein
MKNRLLMLLLATLMLASCDMQEFILRMVPHEDVVYANDFVALFAAHDFEQIEAKLDRTQMPAEIRPVLEKMAAMFPDETPQGVKIVGANVASKSEVSTTGLTLKYQYAKGALLVNVVLRKQGDKTLVTGVHVQPAQDVAEDGKRFPLEGKTATHYAVLAFAIAIPLLVIYALVLCIRMPIPKRKWLWVLFILVGVMQFTLNWTTGETTFTPVNIQLLGVGVVSPGVGAPWLLSVSMPLGAILFLLSRKRWVGQKQA